MDPIEQALAESIFESVQFSSRYSERSLQAGKFQVGISDLGYCSERTRRMIAQQVPEETDEMKAFIGTAVGDHVEKALAITWPDAILHTEVGVRLEGDTGSYSITGHPDLVRAKAGIVLDVKTARGVHLARRTGPTQSQQFQRHLYALGAHTEGVFGDRPLEEVRVANAWFDRSGDESFPHVQMEFYNPEVVTAATAWLDDVVYAFLHSEEARKEPAREVCERTCGFFAECRGMDTDVTGLLTDPTVLAAIQMYQEGAAMEREAKALKDQASAALTGVVGTNGQVGVRWTTVNGGEVSYYRKPYDRLTITKIKP